MLSAPGPGESSISSLQSAADNRQPLNDDTGSQDDVAKTNQITAKRARESPLLPQEPGGNGAVDIDSTGSSIDGRERTRHSESGPSPKVAASHGFEFGNVAAVATSTETSTATTTTNTTSIPSIAETNTDENAILDDMLEEQFNSLNDSETKHRPSVSSNTDLIISDSEESVPTDEPIPPYSPTVTAPPPAEQLATVTPLLNRPLRAEETWCLITKKWLTQWRAYTRYYKVANGDTTESASNANAPSPPGPVDNYVLFKDENCSGLTVFEQPDSIIDYMPEDAWNLLTSW